MEKYYLYDIQNDERVIEVNYRLYECLYGAIFNVEALGTILLLLSAQWDKGYLKLITSIETLVYSDFMDDENRIFKIIKIEVD